MTDCIKIVVGFDQREAIAYHTFSQSVLEKSSLPVLFLPLSMNTLKDIKRPTMIRVMILFTQDF